MTIVWHDMASRVTGSNHAKDDSKDLVRPGETRWDCLSLSPCSSTGVVPPPQWLLAGSLGTIATNAGGYAWWHLLPQVYFHSTLWTLILAQRPKPLILLGQWRLNHLLNLLVFLVFECIGKLLWALCSPIVYGPAFISVHIHLFLTAPWAFLSFLCGQFSGKCASGEVSRIESRGDVSLAQWHYVCQTLPQHQNPLLLLYIKWRIFYSFRRSWLNTYEIYF
jgi:hypothetical protein